MIYKYNYVYINIIQFNSKMSDLEILFNRKYTPKAADYFNSDGKCKVEFFLRATTYKMTNGSRFEILIKPNPKLYKQQRKYREHKAPYVKFKDVRTVYNITSRFPNEKTPSEPKIVSRISFYLDPSGYEAKLLQLIHLASKRFIVNHLINKNPSNRTVISYKKAVVDYCRTKTNNNDVSMDDIPDFGKFCDRVDAGRVINQKTKPMVLGISDIYATMSEITDKTKCQNEINLIKGESSNWLVTKIKVPYVTKKYAKDSESSYNPDPLIRTYGRFGTKFCNFTLKRKMIQIKKKLESTGEQIDGDEYKKLQKQFHNVDHDFRTEENLEWSALLLNKKIPQTTLLKWLGVKIESTFINELMWVDIQASTCHVWYTDDVEEQQTPEEDDDYHVEDESDDELSEPN